MSLLTLDNTRIHSALYSLNRSLENTPGFGAEPHVVWLRLLALRRSGGRGASIISGFGPTRGFLRHTAWPALHLLCGRAIGVDGPPRLVSDPPYPYDLLEALINSKRRCNSAWNLAEERRAASATCSIIAYSISSVGSCSDDNLYDVSSCFDISILSYCFVD